MVVERAAVPAPVSPAAGADESAATLRGTARHRIGATGLAGPTGPDHGLQDSEDDLMSPLGSETECNVPDRQPRPRKSKTGFGGVAPPSAAKETSATSQVSNEEADLIAQAMMEDLFEAPPTRRTGKKSTASDGSSQKIALARPPPSMPRLTECDSSDGSEDWDPNNSKRRGMQKSRKTLATEAQRNTRAAEEAERAQMAASAAEEAERAEKETREAQMVARAAEEELAEAQMAAMAAEEAERAEKETREAQMVARAAEEVERAEKETREAPVALVPKEVREAPLTRIPKKETREAPEVRQSLVLATIFLLVAWRVRRLRRVILRAGVVPFLVVVLRAGLCVRDRVISNPPETPKSDAEC